MDNFSGTGRFWLLDERHRLVSGTLTFDLDGVSLRLFDSLLSTEREEGLRLHSYDFQDVPVVHGWLHDGPEVTLLGCHGVNMAAKGAQVTETWRVDFALSGGLVHDDAFERVLMDFEGLLPWVSPQGIAVDGDTRHALAASPERKTISETTLSDGCRIRVITGAAGTWNHRQVHLDQWCQIEASGEARDLHSVLNDWVSPLQDLLITSLGRASRISTLLVVPPNHPERADFLNVSFRAIQPASKAPTSQTARSSTTTHRRS